MKKLKPFVPLNETVGPAEIPDFKGHGRYILATDKFWVVYAMQGKTERYKSMSMEPQNMLHIVNFIKGGYSDDNESTANEIVGLFVEKGDAKKCFDALPYKKES